MKQTLIKLSDTHYIVVDDSEIKEGDWYYDTNDKESLMPIYQRSQDPKFYSGCKKITHSTQPFNCTCSNRGYKLDSNCAERNHCFDKIQYLSLQEVKELVGEVDMAFERYPIIENDKEHNDRNYYRRSAYYQALEDNKEKKYTEDDLWKAVNCAYVSDETWQECVDFVKEQVLQPKTEWEVEWETIDNRQPCGCSCHKNPNMIHFVACCNDGWIGKITQKLKLK